MKNTLKFIILVSLCLLIQVARAQSIHVIGSPKNSADEIKNIIEKVYFNRKDLNMSSVNIYYSYGDNAAYSEMNIFKRKIKNKKNWRFTIDTFFANIDKNFVKDYNHTRISTAIGNMNKSTKTFYKKKYYVNKYNDNLYRPLDWINLDGADIITGSISKKDVLSTAIIVNSIPQSVLISAEKYSTSILKDGRLELGGEYKCNIGRPKSIEYKISGIHDEWLTYESTITIAPAEKSWNLVLVNLTKGGAVEIRLNGQNGVKSNVIVVNYEVLAKPDVEMVFPPNRGHLANCIYANYGGSNSDKRYFMKIRSNVDPKYLIMRSKKIYDGLENEETNGSSIVELSLKNSNNEIQIVEGIGEQEGLYCVFISCPVFFKYGNNDKPPCIDCIHPYDVWALDFKVDTDMGGTSDWSKPVEVSLVSFDPKAMEGPKCPCE
jgi:hypothetical protein